jgi:radical SAM protein with 4Fe4S-binding SPASM domain
MPPGELSTAEAERLIEEIASLEPGWVIIEGGEPLMRPDLFELLGLMQKAGLEVHLITNGTLLGEREIALLKGLGVRVMISIDGATAETYEHIRRGASFETVLTTARLCAQEGLLEAINTIVSELNYRELPGTLELAASIGVDKVNFIGLKPCEGYTEQVLSPEGYGEAIRLACEAGQRTGVSFFFDEPFFWAVVREWGLPQPPPSDPAGILVPGAPACILGDYLFIEPNGDVKPCTFAPLILGNVREKSLPQIWDEACASPFLKELKDPKSRTGCCANCKYLAECKGCRSRTVALSGDWFASDPACPLSIEEV